MDVTPCGRIASVHDLVGEHVDHAAATQQQAGIVGAARRTDELAEIGHGTADQTTARTP
jgi:hypothetical protein